MRFILFGAALVICAAFAIVFAVRTGRIDYLIFKTNTVIEMNGKRVRGTVLERELWTVVTLREPGHARSYWISSFGDADPVGNIGFVSECQNWTAGRIPILIFRRGRFPCVNRQHDNRNIEWHYSVKPAPRGGIKFVTPEGDRITFRSE